LQAGAAHVLAVDVGRGQLDWGLKQDPRVTELSGVNARYLEPAQVGEAPTLVTADVAFISLAKVLPAVLAAAPEAELVLLVKPQFEAGRREVGKGGVVRDPSVWLAVLRDVAGFLARSGWQVLAATASPVVGPAGNREFFLHARPAAKAAPPGEALLRDAVLLAVDSAGRERKDEA
jgi:23S rRNA (cytidine1920-2'-O)/16S rRNA (cytidine1409-2'-O)-methyltransferase